MTKTFFRTAAVGCTAAFALNCCLLVAHADPNDVVPRGDIAYDQLGSLAATNALPGYTLRDFARGDRLYTREEIAAIIARLEETPRTPFTSRSPFAAALRALRIRFAPELRRFEGLSLAGVPSSAGLLTGQVKLRADSNPAAGSLIGRAALTLPVGRDGFAAVSLGNWRDEWYTTHRGGNKGSLYPPIETAFVRVNGRALDVSVGTSPLRWGPGYFGTLLLSDESASVPRLQVEKEFRLPGSLGRHAGPLYFTQFVGQFSEFDDQTSALDARGSRRYLAGRRLEAQGGPWSFTVSEAIKSTRLPDPVWAMLSPSFYTYQNDWTKGSRHRPFGFLATGALPDTFWLNYVGDVGASYRTGGRFNLRLYGDLVVDDIKAAPGLGLGDNTPRKTGWQVGVYAPRLDAGGRYGLRLEYARLDSRTYTDISRPIQWANDGIPLGYAAGSGVRAVSGRLDAALSDHFRVAIEGENRKYGKGPSLPAGYPFAFRDRVSGFANYALRRDWFVGGRVEARRYDTTETRVEANVGYGF